MTLMNMSFTMFRAVTVPSSSEPLDPYFDPPTHACCDASTPARMMCATGAMRGWFQYSSLFCTAVCVGAQPTTVLWNHSW